MNLSLGTRILIILLAEEARIDSPPPASMSVAHLSEELHQEALPLETEARVLAGKGLLSIPKDNSPKFSESNRYRITVPGLREAREWINRIVSGC